MSGAQHTPFVRVAMPTWNAINKILKFDNSAVSRLQTLSREAYEHVKQTIDGCQVSEFVPCTHEYFYRSVLYTAVQDYVVEHWAGWHNEADYFVSATTTTTILYYVLAPAIAACLNYVFPKELYETHDHLSSLEVEQSLRVHQHNDVLMELMNVSAMYDNLVVPYQTMAMFH